MEKFQPVLLKVWQEACRHIEIGDSTETITAILAEHVPIDRILVRRVDPERLSLETVAVGSARPDSSNPAARTEVSRSQMAELLAWCRRQEVALGSARRTRQPPLGVVVPSGLEGDVLAGPLGGPGHPAGVLLLAAAADQAFAPRHVSLMKVLLEPFSVALANDHQLREMAALREAAEADKRSLLTRLGRKQLADTIVGADSALRPVMERVELVARSDVPVLLLGETGTGKEVLARAIHARSPRATGPVIRVNCGAIPAELIDSQLFGHERGAFTGAVEARRGWFERADGGTLFLDEIGELPPAAQVRLLRILQDGWLERVGGEHPVHVDTRLVAATHRDLAAMVSEGKFREDLWYRIAVFPIRLPPLRERREDVPALARHFAGRAAVRFGLPPVMPSDEDIRLLESYHWPGNIRELASVVDRAAILGNGERLEVATALGGSAAEPRAAGGRSAQPAPQPGASQIMRLDAAIRRHIESALVRAKGRIEGPQGAATLLAINPHTLRARMRKLGIDWTKFREP